MDVLLKAAAEKSAVQIVAGSSISVAALVPAKRGHDSVSFGMDEQRFLRINKAGRVDLNGARGGPWTEMKAMMGENGTLCLHGVKSGKWLTVAGGEFTSSDEPEPLLLQLKASGDTLEKGDALRGILRSDDGRPVFAWPMELCHQKNHALLTTDQGNVRCTQQGSFDNRGGQGPWARWKVQQMSGCFSLFNVGHERYLSLGSHGSAELSDAPKFFTLDGSEVPPASLPAVDNSVLSPEDLTHFKEQGYVIVRNAVPPDLVRDALRWINFRLGQNDCWEADKDPLNSGQLALKLPRTGVGPEVFNRSPLFWSAVNILLGTGNVKPWRSQCQVALRFPQPPEKGNDVPDVLPGTRYHVDGMGQNRLCPFSLLCGVALSGQMKPNMGNLHVFPGSHLHEGLHKYYLDRIADDGQNEEDEEKPNLGKSVQVLLNPGDIVLAHQLLAHRIGVNTSEHIRYQLYYRVSHKDHDELKGRVLNGSKNDPWAEFAI